MFWKNKDIGWFDYIFKYKWLSKSAVCRALLLEKEFDNFKFIEMNGGALSRNIFLDSLELDEVIYETI